MRQDYDRIAHLYDHRSRDHAVDAHLVAWLGERDATAVRVLDVGCGTGKQLAANRTRFPGLALIGVDRSIEMLRIARRRDPSVAWVHGDGQALPLVSSTVDYVTNQYSYPHIPDKRAFVREVFRVIRPGGCFVIQNIDPWSMPDWIIYRFFPEAREVDYIDFLPIDAFAGLLRDTGFRGVRVTRTDDCRDESLRAFLRRGRHTASQFAAISDAAYAAGLRRVQEALGSGEADVIVPSRAALVTIRAEKSNA